MLNLRLRILTIHTKFFATSIRTDAIFQIFQSDFAPLTVGIGGLIKKFLGQKFYYSNECLYIFQ
jgi:hypothetical protein